MKMPDQEEREESWNENYEKGVRARLMLIAFLKRIFHIGRKDEKNTAIDISSN